MQRNKLLLALAFAVALASGVKADFTGKDASLATITFKNSSGACTSVVCVPQNAITDSTGVNYVAVLTVGADAASNTANGLLNYSRNEVFNGTTWDRQASGTALGSILVNNGTAANFLSTATLNQGGSALSATNGIFANILQGNAVISNTNPSFMSVTDGTTKVVVKAASTAAAAADPAFVVAISPNNVLPVKTASGAIASGSYSSGAFASGAYASGSIGAGAVAAGAYVSGSVLSGAYASGSLASGAVVDLTALSAPVTPNTATATKSLLIGGQFNTTQETLTNGQQGQVALSARGAVMVATGADTFSVNCANCTGSGASAVDAATFTAGTSVFAPAGGEFTSGGATACVTGHQCLSAMTASRGIFTDVNTWAETVLGAPSAYGTSPGAVIVPGVNAFVTNTNANGQATAANSSPVVLPAAQVTADPCTLGTKINLPISQNGTASVQLVALSGSTSIYVCSMFLMTNSTATTFAVTTGTGTACAGSNAAVIGSTTANIANSMNLITGAGFTLGNGAGTVGKGAASSELCMILGTNVFVSGNLTYVQL